MKTLNEFIAESSEDMLGLHGKTVPIKTPHFEGHAEVKFDHIKRGKHKTHMYVVHYKGKGGHPDLGPKEPHESREHMDVEHSFGRAYNHKVSNGTSSKDLTTALHKGAPTWVKVSDLKPRPRGS